MRRAVLFGFLFWLLLQPGMLFGWGDCEVVIEGPRTVEKGHSISLTAVGSPEGGTCSWSNTPGILGSGCTVEFIGMVEGIYWVTATYQKDPYEFRCYAVARISVQSLDCEDADGDGHFAFSVDCTKGDDCNDRDATVFPGAQEQCDGKDNDCDGQVDEGLSTDNDGDGHYTPGSCALPNDDPDDNNRYLPLGGWEICDGKDNNGDGVADEGLSTDEDGDAHTTPESCSGTRDDCNDKDPAVYPGAIEICDEKDNNCNGQIDEGASKDQDNDGHYSTDSCDQPNDDCNDSDWKIYPKAEELCDGEDNDCDGEIDEGLSEDKDGDGHYSSGSCAKPDDDCDDDDPLVHPRAEELCDGKDNDCSGEAEDSGCDLGPKPEKGDGAERDQNCAGEPINIATGNVYSVQRDFTTIRPGIHPSLQLRFERTYNSRSRYSGPMGFGWTHNFNVSLIPGNPVALRREAGQTLLFEEKGDGTFRSPSGVFNTLSRDGDGYRYETVEHITYVFTSEGKLSKIRDIHGNKLVAQFEGENLVSISDDLGRSIRLEYADGVRISKVIDPGGREYRYSYDESANLISVSYPQDDGPAVKHYVYEDTKDPHNLTGVVDESGARWLTFSYDPKDRAILSESAGGTARIEVDYSGGDRITVTNSLGKQSVYRRETIDGTAYITSITEAEVDGGRCSTCGPYGMYLYGTGHTLDSFTDPMGNETSYTYDTRGNILTKIEARGSEVERTVSYTYHEVFNKPATVRTASVDTKGREKITEFSYNDTGDLIGVVEKGYVNGEVRRKAETFKYNEAGQVIRIDGPREDVSDLIQFTYYPNDPSLGDRRGMLHKVVTPSGVTEYTDYDSFGRPLQVKDPNGVATDFTYSRRGLMTSRTTEGRSYRYAYSKVGKLIGVTDPENRTTLFRYDEARRLKEIEDPKGNRIRYGYDTEGNRIREAVLDREGSVLKEVSMGYNSQNLLEWLRYPDGAERRYLYDENGNPVSITDENGFETSLAYDPLNRLMRETKQVKGVSLITDFLYDSQDNLTAVIDPEGRRTSYRFDDFKGRLATFSPDSGLTSYCYDEAGNLTSRTDAKGIEVHFTHDGLNRLLKIDYPSDPDVSFTYDEGPNGKGRLTGMRDASGTYSYGYDAVGNRIWEEKVLQGRSYNTEYRYDLAGLLSGVTYPTGRRVDYERDESGEVKRVSTQADSKAGSATTVAENLTYLPFGPLSSFRYGNGIQARHDFDSRYLLKSLKEGAVLDLSYDYLPTGQVKGITDNLDLNRSQSFSYDPLGRLTEARGIYGSLGYTYDGAGNRLTETFQNGLDTYTYLPGTNRLGSIEGTHPLGVIHDENGNITSLGTKTFLYDEENRLIQAMEAGAPVGFYSYNGLGQRVSKEGTHFHYDLSGRLIAETSDRNGKALREYLYSEDRLLALSEQNQLCYTHTDHLGSPIRMTDRNAKPILLLTYTPFGQATIDTGTAKKKPSPKTTLNLRLPGQYYDEETGLHYNWHRFYEPRIGRYTTPDPIGLAGGTHLYAYSQNDPINRVDPLGLRTYMCRQPLHTFGGQGVRSGPDIFGNPLYHQFLCVIEPDGTITCGGQDRSGGLFSPGKPSQDSWPSNYTDACDSADDRSCVDECVKNRILDPSRPYYGIPFGTDCQEWSSDVLESCQAECRGKP